MNKLLKQNGGILLYVFILGVIMLTFISLLATLFSSSVVNVKNIQDFIGRTQKAENIFNNAVERYKNDQNDYEMYLKQEDFEHSLTQYKKDQTVFLHSSTDDKKDYIWSFNDTQREIAFIKEDSVTGEDVFFDNKLDEIKSFKIYWNMKTDISNPEISKYNPMQRVENAHLRITLEKVGKVGLENSKRCFNTNNSVVIDHITIQSEDIFEDVFNNALIIDESYFKSFTLSDDCTKIPDYVGDLEGDPPIFPDPYEPPLLNGNNPLDFNNYGYTLTIEVLSGETSVRVNAVGNNGYIPTDYLDVEVIPEKEGDVLEEEVYVGEI